MSRSTIFAMTTFDGICQYLEMSPNIFAQALTVSEILTFKMFDLQTVGQGHEILNKLQ